MKELIRKFIYYILRHLPNSILLKICGLLKNKLGYYEQVERIRLSNFVRKTDFHNLDVSKMTNCSIELAEFDYKLFNMCFFNNMLRNIIYCLSKGYRPVVNFKSSKEKVNIWEEFLKQPYNRTINKMEDVCKCDIKNALLYIPVFPNDEEIQLFGEIYKVFLNFNDDIQKYIDEEYNKLLLGKRVLGVLCRGTDYLALKPKGHPVQPTLDEVIEEVKVKMKELNCDYIYLATEELGIDKRFNEEFPGKIIINKRKYFDDYYKLKSDGKIVQISQVHFNRENDNYYKSLEYFSSIVLLSKCCGLIAGNCGGSRAALYLNKGKYEYKHLFNKGLY